ncbi:phytoene/squalene synthase family protein [uncultured Erythrobacter sp.]|uniref:phytoene/squalene synthase family protein n=1 Tax=uncultured Erythrobacter sp. TaxID=263913 RepID=UPI002619D843|nr:phytoene/squalene synthase family protein [uncultured Erythrobacter sp.]
MRETPSRAGGGRHRAVLVEKARESIKLGSKSFNAASRLFDRGTRERVWLLYAWCRRCDDIADAQDHGGALGDQSKAKDRVEAIHVLTDRAWEGLPTADVAFDAFGLVAKECGITREMADDVIAGFELDAADWRPRTERDLMQYCFHVAGAVGVMMARVMGVPRDDDDTLDRACDLGFAFQLANIARDVVEDDAAGRCYLPVEWLVEEDIEPGQHTKPHHRQELANMAARLAKLARHHRQWALVGTQALRFRQRWAIHSAARIYGAIGDKVEELGPAAWDRRVHTSRWAKMGHVAAAFFDAVRKAHPMPAEPPAYTRRDFAIVAEPVLQDI